ncbi:hypothetical protein EVAR_18574_1 [Eumeta japonica]|uniref:Uncharacterized protein n=1 Tax=Eumeta variegata TaxID=151549 RepID=A0A4C1V4B8_EUMVA|nr:hypothetical protein EVAR_18574_1 [Eumeta japonica]
MRKHTRKHAHTHTHSRMLTCAHTRTHIKWQYLGRRLYFSTDKGKDKGTKKTSSDPKFSGGAELIKVDEEARRAQSQSGPRVKRRKRAKPL